MPGMWWWASAVVVVLVVFAGYLGWLAGRVARLHRRAEAAVAGLDAALLRRAAGAAVLADELAATAPGATTVAPAAGATASAAGVTGPVASAADLYTRARAALDASPAEREAAENDLTVALRQVADGLGQRLASAQAWPNVVAASRRLGLARQVHTDVVRDALTVRRRVTVRLFRLTRRHSEPAYFDVDDPDLGEHLAVGQAPSVDS